MTALGFAAFVSSGYVADTATARQTAEPPGPGVRMRIIVLVVIGFLPVLATS